MYKTLRLSIIILARMGVRVHKNGILKPAKGPSIRTTPTKSIKMK